MVMRLPRSVLFDAGQRRALGAITAQTFRRTAHPCGTPDFFLDKSSAIAARSYGVTVRGRRALCLCQLTFSFTDA